MFGFDIGLGAPARRRRKKARRRARRPALDCKVITFKRLRRGGSLLPRSQWVTVTRCKGRRLRATNPDQCRRGGTGPDRYLFAKCPPGQRGIFVRSTRRRRRRR